MLRLFNKYFSVKSVDTDVQGIRKMMRDFDNTICNNIFTIINCMKKFDAFQISDNQDVRAFYYFEILHCLEISCSKLMRTLQFKKYCIRTNNKANGIDPYRIKNVFDIMISAYNLLEDNQKYIEEYERNEATKKCIEYRISDIATMIRAMRSEIGSDF